MIERPGNEIRRRLANAKRTQGWLAQRLGVDRRYVSRLILGRVGVSPEMAIRLAAELGDDAEFWATLQARYDVAKARQQMAEVL
jgi:addiction module HigA family antidote